MTTSPESGTLTPSLAFMNRHWAHWLALGFGSGLVPKAPGTAGTALAWVLWIALSLWLNHATLLFVALWSILIGVWVCERTVHALGVHDHPSIVWDEIAAFWLVLFFVGPDWLMQIVAFALFRFFDAVKPWPIRWVDAKVKGGFGVMIDDVIAAAATLIVIYGFKTVVTAF